MLNNCFYSASVCYTSGHLASSSVLGHLFQGAQVCKQRKKIFFFLLLAHLSTYLLKVSYCDLALCVVTAYFVTRQRLQSMENYNQT